MEEIMKAAISLFVLVLTYLIGDLTQKAKIFISEKAKEKEIQNTINNIYANKEIVKIAVDAVEKTAKELIGEEKKAEAIKRASEMLIEQGLPVNPEQIKNTIEQVLKSIDEASKELNKVILEIAKENAKENAKK